MDSSPPSTEVQPNGAAARAWESTHWTVILQAARSGTPEAGRAFGRLYENYWQAAYWFVRRRGSSPEEAEDLCQDFFMDLLARNALEGLRPELGRFRCFMVAALKNFLANARDRTQAKKRGGGIAHVRLDADDAGRCYAQEVPGLSPEVAFDREWAWTVVGRVLEQLQAEYETAGRGRLFEELRGFLGGSTESRSHAEVARKHGVTVNAVGVAIHRLRRRYGERLRDEVNRTVSEPGEVMDEIRHLLAIIEGQPARMPQGAPSSCEASS